MIGDSIIGRHTTVLSYFRYHPVGMALGYIVASNIAEATGSWRWAFRWTPIIGISLSLIMWKMVQDPPRINKDKKENNLDDSNQPRNWRIDIGKVLSTPTFVLVSRFDLSWNLIDLILFKVNTRFRLYVFCNGSDEHIWT